MASKVSRCSAVAAHGKRCQQSRYKGSPYCWHHMQSRKVPAPSRISGRRAPTVMEAPPVELAAVVAARRDAEAALGARLVRALGHATAHKVLDALEGGGEGPITLIRHTGGVSLWASPGRAQRAAAR